MNKVIELKEEELRLAMLNGDIDSLNKLIDDELVFSIPTGELIDKKNDLSGYASGVKKFSKVDNEIIQIKQLNDSAVVFCKTELEGIVGDINVGGNYIYMRVWQKLKDEWRVVAGQVSFIPSR